MIKLNASFSKKVPVEGAGYSSQSYHASVEIELPDGLAPEQLQDRIHSTFELVRSSVETELTSSNPPVQALLPPVPEPRNGNGGNRCSNGNAQTKGSGKGDSNRASVRQIQFITDLALRRNLTARDIAGLARQEFKVDDIVNLSLQQALLDFEGLRRFVSQPELQPPCQGIVQR